MAKVDGLDGLCNIQDRHILCLTQALDFYAKNNLADLALSKNWSKSDMLQAVAQPLHNISNEYKRSFAFSIPTQKAKTKNGKDASPAIATYTVTMGLSLDEKNNFSLTKTGQCILNHDLSIPSYALTLLSKVGIYNTNNERVTNLLTQFCKYAKDNPNASYTKDDIKKVLDGIGPKTYFDSREDIAFNAFLVSGFLSVSNGEKYIAHSDDSNLISFIATNGDNITSPNNGEESYMGDINKGIVELITRDSEHLFYPKYKDLINIKFGKCNTPLNKHNNFSCGPLQTIYYGAPGTGKSNTIKREVEDAGKIHFRTTFHPDSDYSTFVGCYKPTKNVRHNLMSYVELIEKCKEYAKRAGYNNQNLTQFGFDYYDSLTEVLKDKTLSYASLLVSANVTDTSASSYVTAGVDLHTKIADKIAPITYDFVPQAFVKAYCDAWNNYTEEKIEDVYLIIEEINRGNCAQIFGDLFQLLDRKNNGFSTYPIDADEDLKKFLLNGTKEDGTPWLVNKDGIKDGKLCLPANLHIWATMNTSDQSLFPIDSAFKRRWDWKYVPIDTEKEQWNIAVNGNKYSWSSFLKNINAEIQDTTSSEDKQLGFYFCKAENGVISAEKFVSKVLFYIYNDVFKDYGFERDFFKHENGENKGQVITFHNFFEANGDVNEEIVAELLENLKVEK